ncbi:MAG: hypothetical protein ACRDX8_08800 [Acidimicrobiales bacterium]
MQRVAGSATHLIPQVLLAVVAIAAVTLLSIERDITGATAIAVILAALGITSGGTIAVQSSSDRATEAANGHARPK